MTTKLTYNNLIAELDACFPQFARYLADLRESIKDNVSVYFTFFSVYLKENWHDEALHRQLAVLLQQMNESADEATRIVLHDFLLDVCCSSREHNKNIHDLGKHLTPELQSQFLKINNNWNTAACELPRGCC